MQQDKQQTKSEGTKQTIHADTPKDIIHLTVRFINYANVLCVRFVIETIIPICSIVMIKNR